jgi:hypothetical protein
MRRHLISPPLLRTGMLPVAIPCSRSSAWQVREHIPVRVYGHTRSVLNSKPGFLTGESGLEHRTLCGSQNCFVFALAVFE